MTELMVMLRQHYAHLEQLMPHLKRGESLTVCWGSLSLSKAMTLACSAPCCQIKGRGSTGLQAASVSWQSLL